MHKHATMGNYIASMSSSSPAQPFRALDLPSELVLNIVSFLDYGQVILFSLTCKAAHRLVFGVELGNVSLRILQDKSRVYEQGTILFRRLDFLELLARDLPYHFVCERCQKLHSHQHLLIDDGLNPPVASHGPVDSGRWAIVTFGPLWPQHAFTYNDACGALGENGHESGLRSRLLPQLAISTDWRLARLGATCDNPGLVHGYVKLDTEAIYLNRTLGLHKTQRVLIAADRVKDFFRQNLHAPMEHVFRPCAHPAGLDSVFSVLRPILADSYDRLRIVKMISMINKTLAGGYGSCGPEGWDMTELSADVLGGCKQCRTDFALTVHNHGREGVEIVLDTYQNLGTLSLINFEWQGCYFRDYGCIHSSLARRRKHYPVFDLERFPTPAGKSAQKHPSAPSAKDIWELGEHERRARQSLPR